MTVDPASKNAELLSDLVIHVAETTRTLCGVSDEKAIEVGQAVADLMAHIWGGQLIYFPKGMIRNLSKRDREIYAEFNGSNHSALAKKHDVSIQWIYRIIEKVRLEEVALRQPNLFNFPPADR
ncbi:DNA-binding protein [Nitrosospira lacus]|uniref:DNA-binding protein n=2 Tax=Nitrosospira lacus TaxID=1288494 RepID=A0A1W6STJ0_9PROT|nr:DNA-binding protein [Nitrosospira lacus]